MSLFQKLMTTDIPTTQRGYPLSIKSSGTRNLTNYTISGNSKQSILPDGYTQLEYIGSTGTQWINTGINGQSITRFKVKGYCQQNGLYNAQLIGGTAASSINLYGVTTNGSSGYWYALDSNNNYLVPFSVWATIDVTINSTTSQTGTIINESTGVNYAVAKLTATAWSFPDENLYIFNGGTNRRSPNAKVSYLELYTANGLVFNGIPAKNSSNVLGIYDLVTNTFFTNEGSGSFVEGPTVPNPSAPIEVTSVGSSILPSGYTQLEYIQGTRKGAIDTGISGNNDNLSIYIKFKYNVFSQYCDIFNNYVSDNNNGTRLIGGASTNTGILNLNTKCYTGGNIDLQSFTINTIHEVEITPTNFTYDGITYQKGSLETGTTNTKNIFLFGRPTWKTAPQKDVGLKIYAFTVKDNGVLIQDLIPCKQNSNNEYGFYDLVTNTFIGCADTSEASYVPLTGGPVATQYKIPVIVSGKNLFDANSTYLVHKPCITSGSFPNADGSWPNSITYFMEVEPNTTYTYSCSTVGDSFYVFGLNNVVNPNDYTTTGSLVFNRLIKQQSSSVANTYTFTTNASEHMVAVYCALSIVPTNIQIEKGSTATTYEQYHRKNTNIYLSEPIRKVGTYADVLNSDGTITRKVGVKVLDGAESWSSFAGQKNFFISTPNWCLAVKDLLAPCTHYKAVPYTGHATAVSEDNVLFLTYTGSGGWGGKTGSISIRDLRFWEGNTAFVSDFKQYLAQQYANGTPVVVLYPLATPTTESITVPNVGVIKGDNTITTGTELAPSALSAKFWKWRF